MRPVQKIFVVFVLAFIIVQCQARPTPVLTPAPSPTPELSPTLPPPPPSPAETTSPLYVAIIWHQHQPLYFKDPSTGVYSKPWVRVHAAKDYVDMAAMLENYPDIRVTFNLTPSLLRQLLDIGQGAKDLYWVYTEIPAERLTDEQKAFIQQRFFDINPKIVARFPRYQEIANDRENWQAWDVQTWRDLQVLFNLAWTDPDWLAKEPLRQLVTKGRNFTEADKQIVLQEHLRLVREVIPVHKRLLEAGQIEITTTPFYHPILPLLVDTNLARKAVPDIALPPRFTYGIDAIAQLEKGIAFYEHVWGRRPKGLWPAEGAVAQEIVSMVAKAGLLWMASDEEVLARSLGKPGFARDSLGRIREPELLYRPYIVRTRNQQVYILFRDKVLSDKVGFAYSSMRGRAAARDFVQRLLRVREQLRQRGQSGPFLVSVILDGENAWEHYPNDGKEFLHALYTLLQEEQRKGTLRTVTPTEFITQYPEQPVLERLWPGSWVSPDYLTWIGEEEENRAWEYLKRVREFIARQQGRVSDEQWAKAMEYIYAAEGSDWFWWYGADQNSGDDEAFDRQFRQTLQQVYLTLGKPIPTFLKIPIIPEPPLAPEMGASAILTPTIDGLVEAEEWSGAGTFSLADTEGALNAIWYGFNTQNLFIRVDARESWSALATAPRIHVYLKLPVEGPRKFFTRPSEGTDQEMLLGFGANALVEVALSTPTPKATFYRVNATNEWQAVAGEVPVAVGDRTLEIAIPYALLGKPAAGSQYFLRVVLSDGDKRNVHMAPARPGLITVPELGLVRLILSVQDPQGDDYGPGTYIYPLDPVFSPGAYDLREFFVGEDENALVFRFSFYGALNNAWGAPNGMGIHTIDVYIDAKPGGARLLLPGRNAALPPGEAWDVAIWAEGWTPGIFAPPPETALEPVKVVGAEGFQIVTDPAQKRIIIRVPKKVLAQGLGVPVEALTPHRWKYLAVVLSQEGFPSAGVWRVRDVLPRPAQWRLGGGPEDTNHTRIIDVAYPVDHSPTQEEALSTYRPSQAPVSTLGPDDFPQVPMLTP